MAEVQQNPAACRQNNLAGIAVADGVESDLVCLCHGETFHIGQMANVDC